MEKIFVETTSHTEFLEITSEVEKIVKNSKVKDGICFLYVPHTTASLFINENADPSVRKDIENYLLKLIPEKGNYQHLEGNSASHIRSTLLGSSLSIPLENGSLLLGTWQGIYFAEFDGPRRREVWVKIIKD
ncbi:MAG: secondary thiamine-phosphate synthase enzyme YjbQ [Candidatus Omnitrophica bacterium]|nr:secondary thiamine-phosphate synthase enzyme YjbQ [Candidatus Omnitrophota bacterium]